jgi:hypothetical protein
MLLQQTVQSMTEETDMMTLKELLRSLCSEIIEPAHWLKEVVESITSTTDRASLVELLAQVDFDAPACDDRLQPGPSLQPLESSQPHLLP